MAKENKELSDKIGETMLGGCATWVLLTTILGTFVAIFALGVGLLFLTVSKAFGLAISAACLTAIVLAIWLTSATKEVIRDVRAEFGAAPSSAAAQDLKSRAMWTLAEIAYEFLDGTELDQVIEEIEEMEGDSK